MSAYDLKTLYKTFAIYKAHGIPIGNYISKETISKVEKIAKSVWKHSLTSEEDAWKDGGGILIDIVRHLTFIASQDAQKPEVFEEKLWNTVTCNFKVSLSSVLEKRAPDYNLDQLDDPESPLAFYFGHRSTLISLQRALHIAPDDVRIAEFADYLAMDLVKLKDGTYCVRFLWNGTPMKIDNDKIKSGAHGCVKLFDLQELVVSDRQRFNSPCARTLSRSMSQA
eukprot:CAMPEP_0113855238 /NCGR_PEP_ID=MMETSP0372-20130328/8046_1 /TAXON_ID=340204 /ORGANISM="Lankesteria abbotti" /LENGTH=223 /DNA_ID=CAMNT_0000829059 /DNA_START=11 /DNA_END=682 /DNA_ORIENTATION=- /assembly_acc=CAM_ASM_000359